MTDLDSTNTTATSSSGGLLPPILSASSFGAPTTAFQQAEHARKTERSLSASSSGGATADHPAFDPEKAFGERRNSQRSSSSGSGGAGTGTGEMAAGREAVREEAAARRGAGKKESSILEEGEGESEMATASTPATTPAGPASSSSSYTEPAAPSDPASSASPSLPGPSGDLSSAHPAVKANPASYALTPGLDDIPFSFGPGAVGGSKLAMSSAGTAR